MGLRLAPKDLDSADAVNSPSTSRRTENSPDLLASSVCPRFDNR